MWLTLRLKLRLLGFRISAALVAPLRWNERRINSKRQHQIALQQLQVDANAKVLEVLGNTLITIVDRTAKAQEAQSEVLKTWLDGFKVTSPPTTTAVTDKDEYALEMQQAMEKDGINAANPASVMKWLERESLMTTAD